MYRQLIKVSKSITNGQNINLRRGKTEQGLSLLIMIVEIVFLVRNEVFQFVYIFYSL